ncbi:hypothetical protein QBC33DRAFT_235652 [Phialemonium atrogriseum]|uniref:GATA-type domain-containing protein n=1 Tax=Phialemonium atrogriseum TaxID=1093897 RepID=A0AAJ0CBF2_9PEZI|nr:uncharacterized protein QBC33DRAFT_235652 [Phialemonium atrogriseum]KAK1771186.1 hypothetical protein QBC33DRAFT_235652 [Phialemonium atrogriseum]
MEAGGSGTRQSTFSSARNPEHPDSRPRDTFDGQYRPGQAMATATVMSPSAQYNPHQHQHFPSAYPPPGPPSNMPGMLSPTGSRRTSDEPEARRQLLPSIREVISGSKPSPYSATVTSSAPPPPSLPSPFSLSAPQRPFSDVSSENHTSPRTLHPPSSFPPRSEPMSAFSDPTRPSLTGRPPAPPPPPLSTYSSQQPSPTEKTEHLEAEQRQAAEAQVFKTGYPHQLQQPHQPGPGLYSQTGQLPPGQLPIPGYPLSPRQAGPPLPSPFDHQRPPMYGEENFASRGNTKYEATLDRAFEAWNYGEALNRVAGSARTLFHFAEAFDAAAREQHGAQPIPSRLPTENEVTLMLDNVYMMKKCLEDVRNMVQQSRIINERTRENNARKPFEEDEPGYPEAVKAQFGMGEVKRRRGRAAPPGRCHSCNRIDTPEWRRGPDGARTLCNACGLHYAKLERKRQLEQRSIRPKPSDDRS